MFFAFVLSAFVAFGQPSPCADLTAIASEPWAKGVSRQDGDPSPGCLFETPCWLENSDVLRVAAPVEHPDPAPTPVKDPATPAPTDAKDTKPKTSSEPKRRGLPAPLPSPPFPSSEYQGYPYFGVPDTAPRYALMKALQGTYYGDFLDSNKIKVYGWIDASMNVSTSKNSNFPLAYQIVPNTPVLDQAILRFERLLDTVQTDHLDWGFRFTNLYGIDYRYTTAKGIFSDQLLQNNRLYGYDPLEFYGELYIPWVMDGMVIRVGRYISPPDIEAQLAPDNYLASHSMLYAYDAYTQSGVLTSIRLNPQWIIQWAITGTDDMADWSRGVQPTYFAGVRWVSKDNSDSVYTCLNSINNGKFQGDHDNLQYVVSTWSHRFTERILTCTEAYFMWERGGVVGGSVNNGTPQSFGGGGGSGAPIPGLSTAYGVLNYTMFQLTKQDYITIRNEYWDDPQGERTGFATWYSTHTIGIAHQFNDSIIIRPEIDYDRAYNTPAFNNGTRKNQVVGLVDLIIRF